MEVQFQDGSGQSVGLSMYRMCLILVLMLTISGCSAMRENTGRFIQTIPLFKKPPDEVASRSRNFQPQFATANAKRSVLPAKAQQRLGKPVKPKEVLEGNRYYSANGYVCQQLGQTKQSDEAACFVRGQWSSTAPVLNAR